MGTRSFTKIRDEDNRLICIIYRQFDSYPEGHGVDLANFLKDRRLVNGYNERDMVGPVSNGMGCLAASLVAFLKTAEHINVSNNKIGNIYLYSMDFEDTDWLDYIYTISPTHITVFCTGEFEPQFKGTWEEYQSWIKKMCESC